jgi:hypothetical protein
MSILEQLGVSVKGHLQIKDKATNEILEDKDNLIHPQNLARIFARALANENYHNAYGMALGNGGSYIDSTGRIIYNIPNTTGTNAQLYNETYMEVVDGTTGNSNTVVSAASQTDLTSIVTVEVTLSADEPDGQYLTDSQDSGTVLNPQDNSGYVYYFDELGLVAKNPNYGILGEPEYLLLTHLVFNPIEKTQNRELLLTYTLTISVS